MSAVALAFTLFFFFGCLVAIYFPIIVWIDVARGEFYHSIWLAIFITVTCILAFFLFLVMGLACWWGFYF